MRIPRYLLNQSQYTSFSNSAFTISYQLLSHFFSAKYGEFQRSVQAGVLGVIAFVAFKVYRNGGMESPIISIFNRPIPAEIYIQGLSISDIQQGYIPNPSFVIDIATALLANVLTMQLNRLMANCFGAFTFLMAGACVTGVTLLPTLIHKLTDDEPQQPAHAHRR